jgi:NADPH-dependent ferric siderophore reductase
MSILPSAPRAADPVTPMPPLPNQDSPPRTLEVDTLPSGVRRVRYPLKRRELTVMRTERTTPSLVRITLGGADLHDFVSLGFDDHVKVFIPSEDPSAVEMRDYTPVRYDRRACELDLEFVLHEAGAASDWAAQAMPGQILQVGGPKGSMLLPDDLRWLLMVGDATALPAMTRALASWPAHCTGQLAVLMPSPAERRDLGLPDGVTLHWQDNEASTLEFLQGWAPPPGPGFVWCAGEAQQVDGWRGVLISRPGVRPDRIKASAYWKDVHRQE